jgi:hypothetical protein
MPWPLCVIIICCGGDRQVPAWTRIGLLSEKVRVLVSQFEIGLYEPEGSNEQSMKVTSIGL